METLEESYMQIYAELCILLFTFTMLIIVIVFFKVMFLAVIITKHICCPFI